ncbi:PglZ domain-containing protein [Anaerosalibacter sp. Marseille-P3206]|uniref:PglZ domain-containing protein n=1 Tax=Anaerosalibacter sp. Marseille-P3206 TaxID=1871005 RepID=UPI000986027F|nr:PglZ domain-containing protein [Anaerosalibacter sp. Marseille-P3206]
MIKIIQDPDKLYKDCADIIVNDALTYAKSRLMINEVKEGQREKADIVVVRPSYFKYYEDIYNIPSWCDLIQYSFDTIIEQFDLDFTLSEKQEIKELVCEEDIQDFLKSYNKNLNFDINIIKYIFNNGEFIVQIKNYEELILWMEDSIKEERAEWTDIRLREIMEDNLDIEFDPLFLDRLFSIEDEKALDLMKLSLVSTYLFYDYPLSSKNLISTKVDLLEKNYVSKEFVMDLIQRSPYVIDELNLIISSMKDKLSIFEVEELNQFLSRTKGFLDEEWNWVWNYTRNNFSVDTFRKNLSKIYLWLNVKEGKEKIKLLRNLMDFMELKGNYNVPEKLEDWFYYYENFHLKWFSAMEEEKNIIKSLENLNEVFLLEIINEIKIYKHKMESYYEEFLYKNYPRFLREDKTNIKIIKQVQNYLDKARIFFFVIDGLRWELWNNIKNIFEENEYFIENTKQSCLSMLPSITSVSRTSLITGNTYKTLVDEKQDKEYQFNIYNEEKHLKRNFSNYTIAYRNGGIDEIDELLKENADIYTLIYSQSDAIFHATNNMTTEAMEPLLRDLISRLITKINEYGDMIIVLSTDHGSINIENKKKIFLDIPDIIEEDQHGNCLVLMSQYFEESLYEKTKSQVNENEWYSIWREDSYKYGLPNVINNKEVYAWLFPRNEYYYGRQAKGFVHGGLSMEETIIPYGIYRKQPAVFNDLIVTTGDSYLILDEISFLSLVIYNPNNYGIKRIKINLPNLGITEEVTDLSSKEKRKIILQFKLKDSYCRGEKLKETIKLKIFYLNNSTEQSFRISEKVQVSTVSSINKEMSEKRSLDF